MIYVCFCDRRRVCFFQGIQLCIYLGKHVFRHVDVGKRDGKGERQERTGGGGWDNREPVQAVGGFGHMCV